MTEHNDTELLKFPCKFPIKIIGYADVNFAADIVMTVRQYIPALSEGAIQEKPSKNSKYLAITVTINATSREQLDNIYSALSALKSVIMVL